MTPSSIIESLENNIRVLRDFAAQYPIPDDLDSVLVISVGESIQVQFQCNWAPNEHGRQKLLAFCGETFGRTGWTAVKDQWNSYFNWSKEVAGVTVRLVGAVEDKSPATFPVQPTEFPIMLEDQKEEDSLSAEEDSF